MREIRCGVRETIHLRTFAGFRWNISQKPVKDILSSWQSCPQCHPSSNSHSAASLASALIFLDELRR